MKKLLSLIFCLIFSLCVQAEVFQAGVSVNDVPQALFGSWRVNGKLDKTNSFSTFKPQSADLWHLSREGDTIKLDNPFSGANAEISVNTVEGNLIVFTKKVPYNGNKVLTDTVSIRLEGSKFSGINTLILESYSLVDNHLMKTETATYLIQGEKISGDNVLK